MTAKQTDETSDKPIFTIFAIVVFAAITAVTAIATTTVIAATAVIALMPLMRLLLFVAALQDKHPIINASIFKSVSNNIQAAKKFAVDASNI